MLKNIIARLAGEVNLPIEVSDIVDALVAEGFIDEIHFVPVDGDLAQIRGAFARFQYHTGPYSDPVDVAHIPYNSNDSVPGQRVTCCKELIHLFDSDLERTDTEDEVPEFIEKVLGPLNNDDFGLIDLMASKDKLALYQCLPLLMPRAALDVAREAVASDRLTVQEVAEWAQMPLPLVRLMLDDQWDTLNGRLAAIC